MEAVLDLARCVPTLKLAPRSNISVAAFNAGRVQAHRRRLKKLLPSRFLLTPRNLELLALNLSRPLRCKLIRLTPARSRRCFINRGSSRRYERRHCLLRTVQLITSAQLDTSPKQQPTDEDSKRDLPDAGKEIIARVEIRGRRTVHRFHRMTMPNSMAVQT